jgi:dTDP-4-dehydrorhamnose 3,5-epimerase
LKWFAIELTAANHQMLYIPKLFAHGFQTLEDDTEIFYQMSEFYEPSASRGLRWNDQVLGIQWPIAAGVMSEKDQHYSDLDARNFGY